MPLPQYEGLSESAVLLFISFFTGILLFTYVLYKLRVWYYEDVIHPEDYELTEGVYIDTFNLN